MSEEEEEKSQSEEVQPKIIEPEGPVVQPMEMSVPNEIPCPYKCKDLKSGEPVMISPNNLLEHVQKYHPEQMQAKKPEWQELFEKDNPGTFYLMVPFQLQQNGQFNIPSLFTNMNTLMISGAIRTLEKRL